MPSLTTEQPSDAILVIDAQAKKYAAARAALSALVADYNKALAKLKAAHLPAITAAARKASLQQSELADTVRGRSDLFVKPRTITLHGIRLGFQKCKGVLTHADSTEAVVERIKKHFADEAVQFLIITEKPRASTLMELPASTLKKLGLAVEQTGDAVFIKAADSDVDKVVARLLDEGAKDDES